jgi:hypothetical protein
MKQSQPVWLASCSMENLPSIPGLRQSAIHHGINIQNSGQLSHLGRRSDVARANSAKFPSGVQSLLIAETAPLFI